jgi:hypothetical protein
LGGVPTILESNALADLGTIEANAPQASCAARLRVKSRQLVVLVANQSGTEVDGHRAHAPPLEIELGTRDKEDARVV